MNIFRLTGDLSHLAAIVILLLKIWKTRSCAGERPGEAEARLRRGAGSRRGPAGLRRPKSAAGPGRPDTPPRQAGAAGSLRGGGRCAAGEVWGAGSA